MKTSFLVAISVFIAVPLLIGATRIWQTVALRREIKREVDLRSVLDTLTLREKISVDDVVSSLEEDTGYEKIPKKHVLKLLNILQKKGFIVFYVNNTLVEKIRERDGEKRNVDERKRNK